MSSTFHERLHEAIARNVDVTIVYGKNELSPREQDLVATVPRLSLHFLENLHAKCFTNEQRMVITSMNLYHFSEKNNREMGVLIEREKDTSLFEDAMSEVRNIVHSAQSKTLRAAEPFAPAKNIHEVVLTKLRKLEHRSAGHCIRCVITIAYNPDKPLCSDCYSTWAQFNNRQFPEKVCHKCGQPYEVSLSSPQCYHCYQRNNNGHKISHTIR